MRTSVILTAALLATVAHAATAQSVSVQSLSAQSLSSQNGKWREMPGAAPCFCTDTQGAKHELGSEICLTVGGRSFRARCVMAQNVPFWRDKREGCLTGALPTATPWPNEFAALD